MNKIKEIRDRKGLSLEKVAFACDPPTTPKQIQRLEKGERRLTTDWIMRLAKAMNVAPGEITPEISLNYSQEEQDLVNQINRLEEREKEIVENFVSSLLQKKEKKK